MPVTKQTHHSRNLQIVPIEDTFLDSLNEIPDSIGPTLGPARSTFPLRAELGLSQCRVTPFDHQVYGIKALLDNAYFGLFDEMGAGKTLQVIVAAQLLYQRNIIDRVIVVAPASVRGVWFDNELGELKKYLFEGLPCRVSEFHSKIRQWDTGDWSTSPKRQLRWIVTNYEFLGRSEQKLKELLTFCGPRTLLVFDESHCVKNSQANQTKACAKLRKRCERVVLLTGTPIANSPIDLMSQGNLMHPSILNMRWLTQFRNEYAVMATQERFPKIIGWKNLDKLREKFAPFVLRRLKRDCLDLPEVLPPIIVEVKLTEATWKRYKEIKQDLITWMNDTHAVSAPQAITKVMRLAQLTSGFLGGVEQVIEDSTDYNDIPEFMLGQDWAQAPLPERTHKLDDVVEVGTEKFDAAIEIFEGLLKQDPNAKFLVWCRFKPELMRLFNYMSTHAARLQIPIDNVVKLHGQQKKAERQRFLHAFNPETAPSGPVFGVGTYGTGSMGLNFTACHLVLKSSCDYSFYKVKQSEARVDRPGQIHRVSNYELVAVGPNGQKTIDHSIFKTQRTKEDVAEWTMSTWVQALGED